MNSKITEFSLALYDEIVSEKGVKAIVEDAHHYLQNPISVSNASLEPVAHFERTDTGDEFWERHNSPDMADHYELERLFESSNEQVGPDPKIFNFPNAKYRIMACTAQLGGRTMAYVLILEYERPFEETDKELLKELARSIAYLVAQSNKSVEDPRSNRRLIMARLAKGEFVPKEVVTRYLAENDFNKRFCVVVFEGSDSRSDKRNTSYRADILAQCFPRFCSVLVDGDLILLLQDSYSRLSPEHIVELLEPLTKKRHWQCGVSKPFYNIFKLQENYQNARAALDLGTRDFQIQENVYFFNALSFAHFIELVQPSYNLDQLCDPIFKYLMHYDEDNGTSYFRTLVIYSACRMNMKRCSEILNIHRSTLQYRLDKIVELSGNESLFADPFHLELSVRIIYSLDPDTFKKYEIPTEPFAPALLT